MSHVAIAPVPPPITRSVSRGVSSESLSVEASYAKAVGRAYDSVKKREDVTNKVQTFAVLLDEHSTPGWDGDGAAPATMKAISQSYALVAQLPSKLSDPDVSVNRYGQVELEWYVRPDKQFTLAVGDDGKYYFASLNGTDRRAGSGYMGGVPFEVLLGVASVMRP